MEAASCHAERVSARCSRTWVASFRSLRDARPSSALANAGRCYFYKVAGGERVDIALYVDAREVVVLGGSVPRIVGAVRVRYRGGCLRVFSAVGTLGL